MAFSLTKILKGILLREEGTLTPREIEITPGGTAGTKTTINSSQTTNKTITLPDATDTLIGKATTDTLTNKSINADNNTITNIDDNEIKAAAGINATKIADASVDNTHFQRLAAVNSAIVGISDTQTLTNKTLTSPVINTPTGITKADVGLGNVDNTSDATKNSAVATLTNKTIDAGSNTITNLTNAEISPTAAIARTKLAALTANRAMVTDASGFDSVSPTTSAEIGFVSGVTSSIQTQINAKQDAATAVTLTGTQTLTNKTLTAPVLNSPTVNTGTFDVENMTQQGSTPATPAAGTRKFYSKSDGLYQLDSNGVESKVGSSTGGTKNYLSAITTSNGANTGNGDLELGTTTGWSLFTTTLTTGIPTGTISAGAASLSSLAVVSSGQLAAKYSLQAAAVASWAAGQGFISDAFNIDTEDQAKVLSFKFAYKLLSPVANVNFSGTSSNTHAIYIYDVTNSAWIQPAGVYNLTQSSGVGYASGTFQTTSNSTQYRIAVLGINASTGSVNMYFDDFAVGPQTTAIAPAMSDWVAFTPSGSWVSNTTYTGLKRQIGDSYEYQIYWTTSGAPTSTPLTLNIPETIDTTKFLQNIGNDSAIPFSLGSVFDLGIQNYPIIATYNNTTSIRIRSFTTVTGTNPQAVQNGNQVTQAGPFTWGAGDYGMITFKVPVVGKSSNTVASNDTDTRVVSFSGINTGTQAVTSGTTNINFTARKDSHGAWTGSTYVVPVAGDYVLSACVYSTGGSVQMDAYVNGSNKGYVGFSPANTGSSGSILLPSLKAGDLISLRALNTLTIASDADQNLSIYRLSGPATIAATESVQARYSSTAGTALGTGVSTLSFPTKGYDTHNAFSGNTTYNVPVSGKYSVRLKFVTNTINGSSTNLASIAVNGSIVSQESYGQSYITGAGLTFRCYDDLDLKAGDQITFQFSNGFGSSVNMSGSVGQNVISIKRTGN